MLEHEKERIRIDNERLRGLLKQKSDAEQVLQQQLLLREQAIKQQEEESKNDEEILKQQEYRQQRRLEFLQKQIVQHVKEHPGSPFSSLLASETNVPSTMAVATLANSIGFVTAVSSSIYSTLSYAIYGQGMREGKHVVQNTYEILERYPLNSMHR